MGKNIEPGTGADLAKARELSVTVHYADGGPSLEACMISVLSSRLSKHVDSRLLPQIMRNDGKS